MLSVAGTAPAPRITIVAAPTAGARPARGGAATCRQGIDDTGLAGQWRAVVTAAAVPGVLLAECAAELRYLVLPERPAGTEARSDAALVTRDALIGGRRRTRLYRWREGGRAARTERALADVFD